MGDWFSDDKIKRLRDSLYGMPYELGADGTNATDCGLFTKSIANAGGYDIGDRSADGQLRHAEENGTFFNGGTPKAGSLVFIKGTSDRWTPTDDWNTVQANPSNYAYKGVTHVGFVDENGNILQAGSSGVKAVPMSAFDGQIFGYADPSGMGGYNYGNIASANTPQNTPATPTNIDRMAALQRMFAELDSHKDKTMTANNATTTSENTGVHTNPLAMALTSVTEQPRALPNLVEQGNGKQVAEKKVDTEDLSKYFAKLQKKYLT